MNYISSNLRFLRKLAGLSQEQFAKRVSMNRGNIASYEKGNAEPSIAKLQRIVDYFNVDLVSFIQKDLSQQIATNNAHNNANTSSAPTPSTFKNANDPANQKLRLEDIAGNMQKINTYKLNINKGLADNMQEVASSLQKMNKTMDSMLDVHKELLSFFKNNVKIEVKSNVEVESGV